jgi:hypothetical protein
MTQQKKMVEIIMQYEFSNKKLEQKKLIFAEEFLNKSVEFLSIFINELRTFFISRN